MPTKKQKKRSPSPAVRAIEELTSAILQQAIPPAGMTSLQEDTETFLRRVLREIQEKLGTLETDVELCRDDIRAEHTDGVRRADVFNAALHGVQQQLAGSDMLAGIDGARADFNRQLQQLIDREDVIAKGLADVCELAARLRGAMK